MHVCYDMAIKLFQEPDHMKNLTCTCTQNGNNVWKDTEYVHCGWKVSKYMLNQKYADKASVELLETLVSTMFRDTLGNNCEILSSEYFWVCTAQAQAGRWVGRQTPARICCHCGIDET